MNREILFRGKNKNNKWVYGYLYQDIYDDMINSYVIEDISDIHKWFEGNVYFHELMDGSVGQYTGRKDKNGNKIFEDDIVKDSNGKTWIVSYPEEHAMFNLRNKRNKNDIIDFWDISILGIELEIIGNIHNNPELMENE